MNESIPYADRLRHSLVTAIAAEERRTASLKKRSLLGVVVVTVVAAATFAFGVLAGERTPLTSPALAFTHEGGGVTVRLVDASASPETITRELQDAGIDAVVENVPVSPSLVGKWAGWEEPEGGKILERDGGRSLFIPAGVEGRFRLWVGQAAQPGETYALSADIFSPGEPLHCSGVDVLRPQAAARVVTELGYSLSWRLEYTVDSGDGDGSEGRSVVTTTPLQGVITGGTAVNSKEIILFVSPAGDPMAAQDGVAEQDCGS